MATVKDLIAPATPDSVMTARQVLAQAHQMVGQAQQGRVYYPSPSDWQDEVLYFLLPDRFSDDKDRPLLTRADIRTLRTQSPPSNWKWKEWADSGKRWQGGTIPGIAKRLGYLQQLGVTAIWVGPVLKQRCHVDTYHGYGIQDFLAVDPRFGTPEQLFDLVQAAHGKGIRVILDIILNHSGDGWGYLAPGKPTDACTNDVWYKPWGEFYGNPQSEHLQHWTIAWRDVAQTGFTTQAGAITSRDQGLWPCEFHDPARFTRAGRGDLGTGDKNDPHAEFRRSDFYDLKDLALDVPPTLDYVIDCYKYWIAISDIDGFRVDTIKHMEVETARNFCGAIREFAETLGKRNFLIMGEAAGGDEYQDLYLDHSVILKRNMTAALDIASARLALTAVGKGLAPGSVYFGGFDPASPSFGSHRCNGGRHVSILDDHDHVCGEKLRFSAGTPDAAPVKDYQVVVPTALQLFTLGIPCLYYGTEQAFSGPAQSQLPYVQAEGWNDPKNWGDRYLREAMFGPEHPRAHHDKPLDEQRQKPDDTLPGFGPFGTSGRHCFDTASPAFVRIASLCQVRKDHLALRVGRQYQREIRLPGTGFNLPGQGEVVAWSRILDTLEYVCVVNPNAGARRGGDVLVDRWLSPPGSTFEVIANTAQTAAGAGYQGKNTIGSTLQVQLQPDAGGAGTAYLQIYEVPSCEVLVLRRI